MKYGEYLKELRIGKKMVMRQLARLSGLSMVQISSLERGTVAPLCEGETLSLLACLNYKPEDKEARELVRLIDEPWETKRRSVEEILADPTTIVTRSEVIDEYCGEAEEEAVGLFTQNEIVQKVILRLESIEQEAKIARGILRKVASITSMDIALTAREQQYLSWPGYTVRKDD